MDGKYLNVNIITPQKKFFEGDARSITLPGSKSPFQVLINHAPIVTSLERGRITIESDDGEKLFFESGEGFAEVRENHVYVAVESCRQI
ncbi:MAG: FoF1 ATP synthase subunit delta/epsilon [Chloroflexota bacterium]